jgi:hypothetical protein
MAMPPAAFYRLLYSELILVVEGYRARYRRELKARREESAWLASRLLWPHQAKDADLITPDQLMGRKPRGKRAPKFASEEESARAFVAAFAAQSKQEAVSDGK